MVNGDGDGRLHVDVTSTTSTPLSTSPLSDRTQCPVFVVTHHAEH